MKPFLAAEPMAKIFPPATITTLATQQSRKERRSLQVETQARDGAYTENLNVLEVPSPTVKNTRPKDIGDQVSQPQINDFKPILQDQSQRQGDCRCLHLTLSLLEGFENRDLATDQQRLDSTLANHKSALDHCISMVQCPSCSTRSDYMILLRVVSDKLITSYEQMVAENIESLRRRRPNENDREYDSTASAFSQGLDGGPKAYPSRGLSFGCYTLEGPMEGSLIVSVLIAMQLKQMFALLAHLQSIAAGIPGDSQVSTMKARRQRVQIMLKRIRILLGFIGATSLSSKSPE